MSKDKDNKKDIIDIKGNNGLVVIVINKSERKFLINELLNIIKNFLLKNNNS